MNLCEGCLNERGDMKISTDSEIIILRALTVIVIVNLFEVVLLMLVLLKLDTLKGG